MSLDQDLISLDYKVNLNCKESITLITNFNDIINDILTVFDEILTENDILILNTFKFYLFKNALYMEKLWESKVETDDECDDLLCEGLTILRFWNSMLPQTKLIKPRWFRYALVFPLQMRRLFVRYPDLVMKDICMEGLEHYHGLIKKVMERIEYNKLVDEAGSGCAMMMNDLELSEDTYMQLGMDKASRRSLGGQKQHKNKKNAEERMMCDGIRGRFYRKGDNICVDCRGRIRGFTSNHNNKNGDKCKHCKIHQDTDPITDDNDGGKEEYWVENENENISHRTLLNRQYFKLKKKGKSYGKFVLALFHSYNEKTVKTTHDKMIENNKDHDK